MPSDRSGARRSGSRARTWTFALLGALLAFGAARPVAAALDLPIRLPGDTSGAPGYASDVIEVQLAPAATRVAHPAAAGATRAIASARLGVASLDALATRLGASFTPEFAGERAPDAPRGRDFTAFHIVHLPPGTALEEALAAFRALPEVASASPLALLPVTWFPNDSLFSSQSWLYDTNVPRHDIHAPEAWGITTGDTSIVVAILDTGVLPYHPDLGGVVAGSSGNIWTNWAEAGGLPGIDDDGDGFIDDVHGWDFVTGGAAGGIFGALGEDVDDADNDPNDFTGHGTVVAGIVGAIANNVSGIAGVAPAARILPVRLGWLAQGSSRPTGTVRMDFAAQAIRYATRVHASVINCSFASAYTAGLDSALTEANQAGAIVVVASGNFNSPNYIGTRSDVIAVGATDASDVYWSGTETGPWLDLVARGVSMRSTYITSPGTDSIGLRQPDYIAGVTGTSMAAPVVSGVAAMMQSYMKANGKSPLTPNGMLDRLRLTGDDVSAANPGQPYLVPRVNLYRALTDPGLTGVGPGPVSPHAGLVLAPRTQPARGGVTFDWSASDASGPPAPMTLAVHDVSGRKVRQAELAFGPAGSWTWDGRDGESRLLPAGVYFARLSCGSRHAQTRVVLLP